MKNCTQNCVDGYCLSYNAGYDESKCEYNTMKDKARIKATPLEDKALCPTCGKRKNSISPDAVFCSNSFHYPYRPQAESLKEGQTELPIPLKNMALTHSQWLTILNYTVNNGEVEVDTLFRDKATIQADFFHTKETNEKIAHRNAIDLTIRLLRDGVKITFKDGENSLQTIASVSPPLYDRIYRKES